MYFSDYVLLLCMSICIAYDSKSYLCIIYVIFTCLYILYISQWFGCLGLIEKSDMLNKLYSHFNAGTGNGSGQSYPTDHDNATYESEPKTTANTTTGKPRKKTTGRDSKATYGDDTKQQQSPRYNKAAADTPPITTNHTTNNGSNKATHTTLSPAEAAMKFKSFGDKYSHLPAFNPLPKTSKASSASSHLNPSADVSNGPKLSARAKALNSARAYSSSNSDLNTTPPTNSSNSTHINSNNTHTHTTGNNTYTDAPMEWHNMTSRRPEVPPNFNTPHMSTTSNTTTDNTTTKTKTNIYPSKSAPTSNSSNTNKALKKRLKQTKQSSSRHFATATNNNTTTNTDTTNSHNYDDLHSDSDKDDDDEDGQNYDPSTENNMKTNINNNNSNTNSNNTNSNMYNHKGKEAYIEKDLPPRPVSTEMNINDLRRVVNTSTVGKGQSYDKITCMYTSI